MEWLNKKLIFDMLFVWLNKKLIFDMLLYIQCHSYEHGHNNKVSSGLVAFGFSMQLKNKAKIYRQKS